MDDLICCTTWWIIDLVTPQWVVSRGKNHGVIKIQCSKTLINNEYKII